MSGELIDGIRQQNQNAQFNNALVMKGSGGGKGTNLSLTCGLTSDPGATLYLTDLACSCRQGFIFFVSRKIIVNIISRAENSRFKH